MTDAGKPKVSNPADIAWSAQLVRTWMRRRAERLAAEQAVREAEEVRDDRHAS